MLQHCNRIEASFVSDWPGMIVQKCALQLLYQHDQEQFVQELQHCNNLISKKGTETQLGQSDPQVSHPLYTSIFFATNIIYDDAENNTSKSHGLRTLLMAPAQQEETILVEGTGVVPAKCSPKIKSELFSLL